MSLPSMSLNDKIFCVYSLFTAAALVSSDQPLLDAWPTIQKELCTRRGGCATTLEYTIGTVYMQVIAGISCILAGLVATKGEAGYQIHCIIMASLFSKHYFVDGLMPPPPVMIMTAIMFLASFTEYAKRVYLFFLGAQVVTFFFQPEMVLRDTFADVDGVGLAVGLAAIEVICVLAAEGWLIAALPSKLGLTCAMWLQQALLLKHVILDKQGPPMPIIVFQTVVLLATTYDYGWANLAPEQERAMRVPMKLHGFVLATGFGPLFLAEALGFSPPVIGLANVDSAYAPSNFLNLMMMMVSVGWGALAYMELTCKMEGKLFWAYHLPLSVAVAFWAASSTATPFGKLFMAAPHFFTAWSTLIVGGVIGGKKHA